MTLTSRRSSKSWIENYLIPIVCIVILFTCLFLAFSYPKIKQRVIHDHLVEHFSRQLTSDNKSTMEQYTYYVMYWYHWITSFFWIRIILAGPELYGYTGFFGGSDFLPICQSYSPLSSYLLEQQCLDVLSKRINAMIVVMDLCLFFALLIYFWKREPVGRSHDVDMLLSPLIATSRFIQSGMHMLHFQHQQQFQLPSEGKKHV